MKTSHELMDVKYVLVSSQLIMASYYRLTTLLWLHAILKKMVQKNKINPISNFQTHFKCLD